MNWWNRIDETTARIWTNIQEDRPLCQVKMWTPYLAPNYQANHQHIGPRQSNIASGDPRAKMANSMGKSSKLGYVPLLCLIRQTFAPAEVPNSWGTGVVRCSLLFSIWCCGFLFPECLATSRSKLPKFWKLQIHLDTQASSKGTHSENPRTARIRGWWVVLVLRHFWEFGKGGRNSSHLLASGSYLFAIAARAEPTKSLKKTYPVPRCIQCQMG